MDTHGSPGTGGGTGEERAGARVLLLSERPMFRRGFGKLLGALRPDLSIVDASARSGVAARERPSLVLLDAGGGGDAETLAGDLHALGVRPGPIGADDTPDTARVVVVLDETDDALVDAAMAAGAAGVLIKAAPPGVLAEWLDALLDGETVRPAPSVPLAPEALSATLRARLSARQQKLLRWQMGGVPIAETARRLGMTPAKVVAETRAVMAVVRGRGAGDRRPPGDG